MVKDFKIFESWSDEYVVSIPSGEVIYVSRDDLDLLLERKYIYFNSALNRYACYDFLMSKIKNYLFSNPEEISGKKEIEKFLINCGLLKDQFKINDNGSVDTFGPVNMSYQKLKGIPVKFGRCTSDFNCSHNKLKNLRNSPYEVHGRFNCSFNDLENLSYGPKEVYGAYICNHNLLMSLIGSPAKLKIFDCSYNLLYNMDGAPVVTHNLIKNDNLFNVKKI